MRTSIRQAIGNTALFIARFSPIPLLITLILSVLSKPETADRLFDIAICISAVQVVSVFVVLFLAVTDDF